jgi:D-alanyl-D-alanine carboxypeptidase
MEVTMLRLMAVVPLVAVITIQPPADDLDAAIRSMMASRHAPGVSVAVSVDGRLVKSAAYGRSGIADDSPPLTPSTVLPVLSVTKSFTATGIMLLAEEGKLRLDDAISQYVDRLPAAWRQVTLRQCLSHTAGFRSLEDVPGAVLTNAATGAGDAVTREVAERYLPK